MVNQHLFYQPSSSVPREIAHHDSLAQTFSSQLPDTLQQNTIKWYA